MSHCLDVFPEVDLEFLISSLQLGKFICMITCH